MNKQYYYDSSFVMAEMTKMHAAYSRELLSGRIIVTTYLVKIIALTRPPVRNQQKTT